MGFPGGKPTVRKGDSCHFCSGSKMTLHFLAHMLIQQIFCECLQPSGQVALRQGKCGARGWWGGLERVRLELGWSQSPLV